ncbi:hypothetical protein PIB30_035934 [Stylosanthes scabra]|uniref:Transmembrane protein n=1 Tax=Stylosanthes scabra TaxID=79078 RepID=A0ABU6ZBN9_9FABA|nr:hypothetical protein [Stylosanthes scabra]
MPSKRLGLGLEMRNFTFSRHLFLLPDALMQPHGVAVRLHDQQNVSFTSFPDTRAGARVSRAVARVKQRHFRDAPMNFCGRTYHVCGRTEHQNKEKEVESFGDKEGCCLGAGDKEVATTAALLLLLRSLMFIRKKEKTPLTVVVVVVVVLGERAQLIFVVVSLKKEMMSFNFFLFI